MEWQCSYCEAPNPAQLTSCQDCEAPRAESDEVAGYDKRAEAAKQRVKSTASVEKKTAVGFGQVLPSRNPPPGPKPRRNRNREPRAQYPVPDRRSDGGDAKVDPNQSYPSVTPQDRKKQEDALARAGLMQNVGRNNCAACSEEKHPSVMWQNPGCKCWGCYECLMKHYTINIKDGRAPTCWCNQLDEEKKAKGKLLDSDFEEFSNGWLIYKSTRTTDQKEIAEAQQKVFNLNRRAGEFFQRDNILVLGDDNLVRCPGVDCGYQAVKVTNCEALTCPNKVKGRPCQTVFCSNCGSTPFHTALKRCSDVATTRAEYVDWVRSGREQYLTRMAQLDAKHQRKLDAYNRDAKRHAEEKRHLERMAAQLEADEQYKRANCRRCPNCNRVFERLSGCSSMVCGRNYHGGDVQDGCGHQFDMSDARPYESGRAQARRVDVKKVKPEQAKHLWMENGEPIVCDMCEKAIEGPVRLQCACCPYFNVCAACEPNSVGHRKAPATHSADHYFKIIRVKVKGQEGGSCVVQ